MSPGVIDEELLKPYRMVIHRDRPAQPEMIGEVGEFVRFYLPLPEPLGLPDGWVRPRLNLLKGPLYATITAATGDDGYRFEVVASMCFMRVTLPTSMIQPAIQAMNLAAARALPGSDPPSIDPPVTDRVHTVVEVAALVSDRSVDELSRVFDVAVEAIADVQASYATASGRSVTKLTRPRCPILMPMFHHPPAADPKEWHADASMFWVHDVGEQLAADDTILSDDLLGMLDTVHGMRMERAPFLVGRDLVSDGRHALRIAGEPRNAVISVATGCESMLDDLLCCLMWEDGERPEEWSSFFDQSLTRRVKSGEYSNRLKGSWSLDGQGAVARWFHAVRYVRNHVVHSGAEPSAAEARDAVAAAVDLTNFFVDRLRNQVAKYPRTASMAGAPSFLSKRALARYVTPLTRDPAEPPWRETARRWEWVMRQGTDDGPWSRTDPADETQHLRAVKHATGDVVWVLVTDSGRVSRINEPSDYLSAPQLEGVRRIEVHDGLPAVSIGFVADPDQTDSLPRPQGPWLPGYRLLPDQPVMVAGESLDPP